MKKQMRTTPAKLVPVTINGATVLINPASINKAERTVHHGEFNGVKVNSPATFEAGDSMIIWADADKPAVITMSKAALGVLATQYLEKSGYTVKKN